MYRHDSVIKHLIKLSVTDFGSFDKKVCINDNKIIQLQSNVHSNNLGSVSAGKYDPKLKCTMSIDPENNPQKHNLHKHIYKRTLIVFVSTLSIDPLSLVANFIIMQKQNKTMQYYMSIYSLK